ncbi:DUF5677 domain-containing protein [uncultured Nitrosomonas sp.]|uniref:DUF5677 domain-containing protein n=1 Tax=uncultured Nitrosomonas sp. TaxID=156424 RepID=UPI0025ED7110|nr:DUF5677 domain-containing protein [uncultured Nitrosomonas sp.]
MFTELFRMAETELKADLDSINYEDVLNLASEKLYDLMVSNEVNNVDQLNKENEAFVERNYDRWIFGFQKLQMLKQVSLEAGIEFQKQFLQYPVYKTDPLLGVLMRQHANACRITGEIIWLLKGGYADGALARWRTLFEISVTCLVIRRYGCDAAIDYIKHGRIKAVEGMQEYQKTAREMNLEPYPNDELEVAIQMKETLSGGDNSFSWARKYIGSGRLEKLREHAGLGKWSHYYKLASKNVHADFSEMLSLFAMSEAKQDLLLAGPSNSGLVEPAHMTAITLSQITSAFLTVYIEDESNELDYSMSFMFLSLVQKYVDAVGQKFLKCSSESSTR